MKLSRPWLAAFVAILVAASSVFLWRGCGGPGDRTDRGTASPEDVQLTSPDLDVELLSARGTVHPGYTEWACVFECREQAGCHADVELEIAYLSEGAETVIRMAGRLDAAQGETMRIGRAQRPPSPVDRVEKVYVRVAATFVPGDPRPTPLQ
jgi:hypothetical protein